MTHPVRTQPQQKNDYVCVWMRVQCNAFRIAYGRHPMCGLDEFSGCKRSDVR